MRRRPSFEKRAALNKVLFGFEASKRSASSILDKDRVLTKKGGLYRHLCQFWLEKNNLRQPNAEAHVVGLLTTRCVFRPNTRLPLEL